MKPKESRELLKRIEVDYKPLTPLNKTGMRVLVHYLPYAMDNDEIYENEGIPFRFEVFTTQQVFDIINKREESFGLFGYTFTTEAKEDSDEYKEIINMFSEDSFAWVTMVNRNKVQGNVTHIPGKLSLSCCVKEKYFKDACIPKELLTEMCWEKESLGDENQLKEKNQQN